MKKLHVPQNIKSRNIEEIDNKTKVNNKDKRENKIREENKDRINRNNKKIGNRE